jgi:Xaa-Pro aminopeptidase
MLTAEGCKARRDRLFAALLPHHYEVLVVGDPTSLVYFANYVPSPFEFRTVESSALLILEPGRATLIADNLLQPYLDRAHVDEVYAPIWYDGNGPTKPRRRRVVDNALGRLASIPSSRIGIESGAVPSGVVQGFEHLNHSKVTFQSIDPTIRRMRRSKDADEIEVLKRAMRAGEAAHATALKEMKPGMTELDAYLIVQNAAMKELGERVIVYGDFASGPRTATDKGGPPTSRRIEAGDLLLLDFSVVVDGYRTDFTNTFAVGGGPTPDQRKLFDACVGAMKAGESKLKAGTPAVEADTAVREHFRSLGLLEHFPHHTGHGIGLGHPEPPYFVPQTDEILVAGDVVTLEPGLYIEGVGGIRIERNYLVTAEGFETLSKHEIRVEQ